MAVVFLVVADMHNRHAILFALCLLPFSVNAQKAHAANADIDCFNPGSTVASAVCGDPELLKLYKLTEEAYTRVQTSPAALSIYIDLLHARETCVRPKSRQPYKVCIVKREFEAFTAFNKLRTGRPKPAIGHGALGMPI